jgi:hypothetical protein
MSEGFRLFLQTLPDLDQIANSLLEQRRLTGL